MHPHQIHSLMIREELTHIPRGVRSGPQGMLRYAYSQFRKRGLVDGGGTRTGAMQMALDALKDAGRRETPLFDTAYFDLEA